MEGCVFICHWIELVVILICCHEFEWDSKRDVPGPCSIILQEEGICRMRWWCGSWIIIILFTNSTYSVTMHWQFSVYLHNIQHLVISTFYTIYIIIIIINIVIIRDHPHAVNCCRNPIFLVSICKVFRWWWQVFLLKFYIQSWVSLSPKKYIKGVGGWFSEWHDDGHIT